MQKSLIQGSRASERGLKVNTDLCRGVAPILCKTSKEHERKMSGRVEMERNAKQRRERT